MGITEITCAVTDWFATTVRPSFDVGHTSERTASIRTSMVPARIMAILRSRSQATA